MSRQFVPPLSTTPMGSEEDFYQYSHVHERESLAINAGPGRVVYDYSSSDDEYHADNIQQSVDPEYHTPVSPFTDTPKLKSATDDTRKYKSLLHIFLAVSILSAVIVMCIEAYMYVTINVNRDDFESDMKYSEISIYLALFIFASVYQIVITIIGLRTKNMMLLSMLCVFYVCMLVYTGLQYKEISHDSVIKGHSNWPHAVSITNIVAICVLGVTLVIQGVLVLFLKSSVKWFRFKKIGASFEIKRLYTIFQIHRSLLVFDLFFFLGFTVQFLVIMVGDKLSVEFILTCCVLPLTILVLFFCDYAATREYLWLSVVTLLCLVGGAVYVLFKTIRLFTKYTSAYNLSIGNPGSYFPGRTSLVSFAIITLIFLVFTIVLEIVVVCNYNKGLLPFVNTYYSRLPGADKHSHQSRPAETLIDEPEKSSDASMLID
ncbi:CIC11C00000005848 [Sungouiella intermedia]|uniref:CIC11C00000005848 n=1 Tax=Sungouiella intermedia TaxID=45354 RepID=A0A1L0C081_9ASCO|nr:CIC11C00000005848 [[Candida] intermedia]